MATIERTDLINAVLRSRDELDADLDSDFLTAVVDAEADAGGDGDAAIRSIDTVVVAAIARGVGHVQPAAEAVGGQVARDQENEN